MKVDLKSIMVRPETKINFLIKSMRIMPLRNRLNREKSSELEERVKNYIKQKFI